MLWIAGTLAQELEPLAGRVEVGKGPRVRVGGVDVEVMRGTGALLAAVGAAQQVVGGEAWAWVGGDDGSGQGSKGVWDLVARELGSSGAQVLMGHYIIPNTDAHARVMACLEEMDSPPLMLGDAGFMYAAKASGMALSYEIFTPDLGELAFLADPEAPHPFYARGFFLSQDIDPGELASRAWSSGGAARVMLVKGKADLVVEEGRVAGIVDAPVIEAMEAIGGTGDSLFGILGALVAAGMESVEAGVVAARANRLMGLMASPTPATTIAELIAFLPLALERALAHSPRDTSTGWASTREV